MIRQVTSLGHSIFSTVPWNFMLTQSVIHQVTIVDVELHCTMFERCISQAPLQWLVIGEYAFADPQLLERLAQMETELGGKSPTRDEEGGEKKKTEDGEDEDEPIEEDEDDYQDDDDYYQVCSRLVTVQSFCMLFLQCIDWQC